MLKLHEWVHEAHIRSGLSASELSRRFYARLGRDTEDRSIIGKMSKEPGSAGTKARRISVEELLVLSEITGHPLPEHLRDVTEHATPPESVMPPPDAVFTSGLMPRYEGPRDVEKLGVVAAGDDGDFQFNGEVIEYVMRPRGLIGRPGVFSLEVISDSMYPAYRKGDVVFCDRLDPKIGDDVVIEEFPEIGETAGRAYVKRLKRRTKGALVVEQFNPPADLNFDPYAIKHLWRVVPNRELHGY